MPPPPVFLHWQHAEMTMLSIQADQSNVRIKQMMTDMDGNDDQEMDGLSTS